MQNAHTLRLFKIFDLLSNRKLTSTEIFDKLIENDFKLAKRTLQRDLEWLRDNEYIKQSKVSSKQVWEIIHKNSELDVPVKISGSEFLSFCILKNYLKSFKGTEIEADINTLQLVIEKFVAEYQIEDEVIFWDQNFGNYDYSGKSSIITEIIRHIVKKNHISFSYHSQEYGVFKDYNVVPVAFYYYNGSMYLIAYNLKHGNFLNFTLQFITDVKLISEDNINIPKFDMQEFKEKRFGVFDGEMKEIRLRVDKTFRRYFENRTWHPSQKTHISPNTGDLIIEMKVPISPELLSWLLGWGDTMYIESPISLRDKVKALAESIIAKYK